MRSIGVIEREGQERGGSHGQWLDPISEPLNQYRIAKLEIINAPRLVRIQSWHTYNMCLFSSITRP